MAIDRQKTETVHWHAVFTASRAEKKVRDRLEELGVRIAVCDFAGRELWVHNEQGISSGGYYYVDWDLCSNAGQRLSPGIYLYRASITSGDSKESTKTEKIVILAQ